jgi:hypothetical protein
MAITPQENMNVAAQQNADVMQAMQGGGSPMANPQVQQAQQMLMQMMEQTGLQPEQLKELGKLAEMSIQDKQAYPMFLERLRMFGLDDAESMRGEIDYQALAVFATAAKLI